MTQALNDHANINVLRGSYASDRSAAVFLAAANASASLSLSAFDGRSWHDFNLDGVFNDGVSSPTATALVPFSNQTRAARGAVTFAMSDIPTNTAVSSATLTLYFTSVVRT